MNTGPRARNGYDIALTEILEGEHRFLAEAGSDRGAEVHCLRDLTRGGLASAVIEVAETARLDAHLDERAIAVSEPVRSACELLGFDPLHVANEGRFAAWVAPKHAAQALEARRAHPLGRDAVAIGTVGPAGRGTVTMRSQIGAARVLDMLSGEQLPRIC